MTMTPQTNSHLLGVGARLKEAPAEEMLDAAFAHEITDGPVLYRAMSLTDIAYAVMLCETNIVPHEDRAPLMRGLLALHAIPADAFPYDAAQGDIYQNREHRLQDLAERGSGWLRAGRARRESSTVGYVITVRANLLSLIGAVADLIGVLTATAKDHLRTLMPDYTYLQKAHPTTLAHYLMGFTAPLLRDGERLRAAYGRFNQCPAAIGSVNGSRLPLDRERVAALLGFPSAVPHTRDAMWAADLAVEAASALMALMVTVDRLAEDLYIFATEEFGYLTLADAHSRISVIMPQKKNPYSLAFVRGVARHTLGVLNSVIATNLTPSGQPDNRLFAYGDLPRALDAATKAIRLLAGAIRRADWDTDHMARRAGEGFSGATDLADHLTEAAGLDPREAHKVVGYAVREAVSTGERLITAAGLDFAAQATLGRALNLPESEVLAAQDPVSIVHSRTGLGGAAPARVAELVATAAESHADLQWWADSEQTRLEVAETALMTVANRIAQG